MKKAEKIKSMIEQSIAIANQARYNPVDVIIAVDKIRPLDYQVEITCDDNEKEWVMRYVGYTREVLQINIIVYVNGEYENTLTIK